METPKFYAESPSRTRIRETRNGYNQTDIEKILNVKVSIESGTFGISELGLSRIATELLVKYFNQNGE